MVMLIVKERMDFICLFFWNICILGYVSGIIYGKDMGNKFVLLDSVELIKMLRDEGKNIVIMFDVSGEKYFVMVIDL